VDGRADRSTWIYRTHRNLWRARLATKTWRNRPACPVLIGVDLAIYAAGQGPMRAACSRIRRIVLRQVFLPGRADPDPSGSSRSTASCGLVDAEKVWRNLVGLFLLCKCLFRLVHNSLTLRIVHASILPSLQQRYFYAIIASVFRTLRDVAGDVVSDHSQCFNAFVTCYRVKQSHEFTTVAEQCCAI
jgi:hypothetical protein